MLDNYKIQSCLFRYVVPFRVGVSDTFGEIHKIVEKQTDGASERGLQSLWIRQEEATSESDIYEYVRNEFRFNSRLPDNCNYDNKVGVSWLYKSSILLNNSDSNGVIKDLYYVSEFNPCNPLDNTCWKISVNNVGLLVFKNGIGILWYDLVLPDNVDTDRLISFQNDIKELNRGHGLNLWKETINEPLLGYVHKKIAKHKTGDVVIKYREPFSLAEWISDLLSPLEPQFFAKRKSAFVTKLKYISQVLSKYNLEVIDNRNGHNPVVEKFVPDKSVLFSYVSIAEELSLSDKRDVAYFMSKGYGQSYKMSSDTEFVEPFDNVIWHSAKEGCAIIATGNTEFIRNGLKGKVGSDYFDLFLRVIYQSYSLLHYAEKIQFELSGEISRYLAHPIDDEITKLYGEINLFLAKSMATSVSYIHQQNEFYIYLKDSLGIQEDVESVCSGLEALDSLQREEREAESDRIQSEQAEKEKQRDNKLQAIMGLFALLSIFSALTDCFDFIAKFNGAENEFTKLEPITLCAEIVCLCGILTISLATIRAVFKQYREANKTEKET